MKRHFQALGLICCLSLLAGCYSIGTDYNDNAAKEIKLGQSESDVVAKLGQPDYVTTTGTGSKILTWTFVKGSNFIVASENKSKSVEVTLTGGKVSDLRSTYSANYWDDQKKAE